MHGHEPYLRASVVRTPVYPALMALVFAVRDSIGLLVLLQLVVGAATACLTAHFAYRIAGARAGLLAGLVVALDPVSIIHANEVMTETLFTLVFLAAAFALWRSVTGAWRWALASGALFALATLTRPVALFVFPVVLIVAAVTAKRRRMLTAAALAVVFALPVGLWIVRNDQAASYPGISLIEDVNLLYYRAAGAISLDTGKPIGRVRRHLQNEARRRMGPSPTVGEEGATYRRMAIREIKAHPVGFINETARGASRILFGPGGTTWEQLRTGSDDAGGSPGRLVELVLLGELVALLVGAAAGVWALVKKGRSRLVGVIVIVPLSLVAISAGQEAYSRFRMPVAPFPAILLGVGVAYFDPRSRQRLRALAPAPV